MRHSGSSVQWLVSAKQWKNTTKLAATKRNNWMLLLRPRARTPSICDRRLIMSRVFNKWRLNVTDAIGVRKLAMHRDSETRILLAKCRENVRVDPTCFNRVC